MTPDATRQQLGKALRVGNGQRAGHHRVRPLDTMGSRAFRGMGAAPGTRALEHAQRGVVERRGALLVLLPALLLVWIALAAQSLVWARWIVPLLPVMSVLIAIGSASLLRLVPRRYRGPAFAASAAKERTKGFSKDSRAAACRSASPSSTQRCAVASPPTFKRLTMPAALRP